ncbi:MAG: methyltransferase domain-containing protein [Streptosporangiales bacterium]|nr:methyltransferase domain-containing protein [Streptosporangiales bacterium]
MGAQATVGGKARRAARVAVGLARPSSRPRYVAAVRRRLRSNEFSSGDPNEICLVCGAGRPKRKTIRYSKDPNTVCDVRVCRRCGHVGNPDNVHDYRNFQKLEKLPLRARVGTEQRQGREFYMAKMAAEMLGRPNLSVLVYGAGRSFDNKHIEALPNVHRVAVADVMKLRDDTEFVDINQPANQKFSLVLASEVVEHFLNPQEDFQSLFNYVEDDGLLLCSTNVYDGSDLAKHKYIFIPGHTSYYTPEALAHIARSNGYYIDFRVPWVATGYGGPRKRYLFLTKDLSLLTNIACYFGKRMYAPSERPHADTELAEAIAAEKKQAAQQKQDKAAGD